MLSKLSHINLKRHAADALNLVGYITAGGAFCKHEVIVGLVALAVGMVGQSLHDVWKDSTNAD